MAGKRRNPPEMISHEENETRSPEQVEQDRQDSEFLGEDIVNGQIIAEVPEDDSAQETEEEQPTKVEEPKEEAKPETPPFDPAEVTKQITDQVTKNLTDHFAAQGATKEEKDELEESINQRLQDFQSKEGRDPTWYEATKIMSEISSDRAARMVQENFAKAEQDKKEAEERATKEAQEKAEAEYAEFDKYIDEQIDEMIVDGILPPKKDGQLTPEGAKVAAALLDKMHQVKEDREKKGLRPIYDLYRIYERDDFIDPREQPPGGDAPIAGAGVRAVQPESTKMTPQQWRRMSYEDIVRQASETS